MCAFAFVPAILVRRKWVDNGRKIEFTAQEKGRSVHFNSKLAWNDFPILKKQFANEASFCAAFSYCSICRAATAKGHRQLERSALADATAKQKKESNMQMLNLKVWCMIAPTLPRDFPFRFNLWELKWRLRVGAAHTRPCLETEVLNNSPRRNGFCVEVACYTWTWMLRRCDGAWDVAEKITW